MKKKWVIFGVLFGIAIIGVFLERMMYVEGPEKGTACLDTAIQFSINENKTCWNEETNQMNFYFERKKYGDYKSKVVQIGVNQNYPNSLETDLFLDYEEGKYGESFYEVYLDNKPETLAFHLTIITGLKRTDCDVSMQVEEIKNC